MFDPQELTVTDDTVLEGHNEDPTLVQMRLIGDRGKIHLIFSSFEVSVSTLLLATLSVCQLGRFEGAKKLIVDYSSRTYLLIPRKKLHSNPNHFYA